MDPSIIERSETHVSAKLASISMAVIQLVGTILTPYLVDTKDKRTKIFIVPMTGYALGLAVMGTSICHSEFDTSMFH